MKLISKQDLEELYLIQKKNPYEIGEILGAEHKTIRSRLKLFNIPLRNASEYNYIYKATHVLPTIDELLKPKSVAAHIAYLCEGHHTAKAGAIMFCNQDTQLIDLVYDVLKNTYKTRNIRIEILTPELNRADYYIQIYPDAKVAIDLNRKNPIIRLHAGGKTLVRDLVQNAYRILEIVK